MAYDAHTFLVASGVVLHYSIAETANGVSAAAGDISAFEGEGAVAVLNVGTVAGTNPTLDVKITECATSGGTYADSSYNGATLAFPQVTAANTVKFLPFAIQAVKQFLKAAWTIGGTSNPAFTFGVTVVALPKYI